MVREVKHRIILMRTDGTPLNIKYEPVKSLSAAARFTGIEDFNDFITGYYKPPDASLYMPRKIRITYEEEDE